MTVIAHRGATGIHPEHSRATYLEALSRGADGLETDVRLTADGHLVCWHDATTDRITGVAGTVHALTLDELRALDVMRGRELPARFGALRDQIVTLPELLQLMRGEGRPLVLALELKQPSPDPAALDTAVLAALDDAGWDPATGRIGDIRVDLMSFWPRTIAGLRDHVHPSLLSILLEDSPPEKLARWVTRETGGLLTGTGAAEAVRDAALVRDELLTDPAIGIGPDIDLVRADPDFYRGWAAAGRPIRVWTVNDPADALLCERLGITEITTDQPEAIRAALSGV